MISLPKTAPYHSTEEPLTSLIDGVAGSDEDLLDVYAYIRTLAK